MITLITRRVKLEDTCKLFDVNARDNNDNTPLTLAAGLGKIEVSYLRIHVSYLKPKSTVCCKRKDLCSVHYSTCVYFRVKYFCTCA